MAIEKKEFMTIDGIPVEINGEKNLLELIRKVGVKMPTFCYHSELSIYGACRMCMVENKWGGLEAACSTPPKAGMEIRTNTERLRKYRKMILELLLANHCRDCTTCDNNGSCKLQDLAKRFDINDVRFPNTAEKPKIEDSSVSIVRDQHKCILCGDCVRMCSEVQNVGAIDFAHRGSKMTISTAFDMPLAETTCVGCGQCAQACPTGAIVVKNNISNVWKILDDPTIKVSVQVAPAVRVALGKELGAAPGENAMGKIVAALHRMGFDEVYDTSTSADMTVIEEAEELAQRLAEGKAEMPMFSSCCPAWVRYCENRYPDLMEHVSTCKSPMQMFSAVIREKDRNSERKCMHVAVMPCTAKKFEAVRDEFKVDGKPDVDYVLTTQELVRMIKEAGILFRDIEPEAPDMPFGTMTGAGVIFGVTGGVTEAVLRRLAADKSSTTLRSIAFTGVRGMEGVKEAHVMVGEKEVRIGVVSGLRNASNLIERIKNGEHFDFVEVMACPGGCVNGGGQPFAPYTDKEKRGAGLYAADRLCSIKSSEENPLMATLYDGLLKGRSHELLHVHYHRKEK
ncbi:MAG: [FeFe] hydrogenase, group A [bacterium]|nr:[FeFe] hydrogenase, group A [bacterium]